MVNPVFHLQNHFSFLMQKPLDMNTTPCYIFIGISSACDCRQLSHKYNCISANSPVRQRTDGMGCNSPRAGHCEAARRMQAQMSADKSDTFGCLPQHLPVPESPVNHIYLYMFSNCLCAETGRTFFVSELCFPPIRPVFMAGAPEAQKGG